MAQYSGATPIQRWLPARTCCEDLGWHCAPSLNLRLAGCRFDGHFGCCRTSRASQDIVGCQLGDLPWRRLCWRRTMPFHKTCFALCLP